MRRVAFGGLVAALVLLGFVPRASAMVPTDPWVPPSVATHDGLAASTLAVGGASVPVGTGDAADVVTRGPEPVGGDCWLHVTTWEWAGTTLTVRFSLGGAYPGWCGGFQSHWLPVFVCVVTTAYEGHPLGTRVDGLDWGSSTFVYGARTPFLDEWTSMTGAAACGPDTELLSVEMPLWVADSRGMDFLRAFRPGASALLLAANVTAVTTCSDSSTYSATFLPGLPVSPAACATGSLVSVTLSSGGLVVGTTAVHPEFVGNPCLTTSGGCALAVTSATGSCTNRDPNCSWWGFTDAATACAWQDSGGVQYVIPVSDCEAARTGGYWMPHPVDPYTPPPTSVPTPTPTPDGTPAIVSAVEAAARAVVKAVSDANEAANAAAADVGRAIAGVGAQVADLPAEIGKLLAPDPGRTGSSMDRIKGAGPGADIQPWFDALGSMVTALIPHPSSACEGPPLTITSGGLAHNWLQGTYYPLAACVNPMAGVAILCKIALSALVVVAGLNACIRGILAGFDLSWGLGNISDYGSGSHSMGGGS